MDEKSASVSFTPVAWEGGVAMLLQKPPLAYAGSITMEVADILQCTPASSVVLTALIQEPGQGEYK